MKTVIMESLGISPEEMRQYREPFESQGVIFAEYEKTDDPDRMIAQAEDADVMIVANMPIPEKVIRA